MSERVENERFDVCLSFADEDDADAKELFEALDAKGKRVFYYKEKQKGMLGGNILKTLYKVYHDNSKYCVAFLSASYKNSKYGLKELEWANDRVFEDDRDGYLIPVRIDDTKFDQVLNAAHVANRATLADDLLALIEGWTPPPPRPWWANAVSAIRRFIRRNVLAVVLAVLAVSVASWLTFYYYVGPSQTDLQVLASDEKAISVAVSNEGPKPATLTGFRLTFSGLPIEPATLVLTEPAKADVAPHSRTTIGIAAPSLHAQCKPGASMRYIEPEIEPLIPQKTATATLEISVRESDRSKTVKRQFPAATLTRFIRGKVANHARRFEC